ncbi:Centrosomal protein of 76 kDa [Dinochytrium kinnereticum]|nr:Centrosomal protein of 76 kDa [Dinochytrium kinnereticum]
MNAYMTLGSSKTVEAIAWVTTISSTGVVEFWDPAVGSRWLVRDVEAHGFRTVGCLFNHEVFYANANATDSVVGVEFDLSKDWIWKPIPNDAAAMSRRRSMDVNFPILPFQMSAIASSAHLSSAQNFAIHEEDLEAMLRQQIASYREDYDMKCLWDNEISRILSQCLWGCEMGRLMRASSGGPLGGASAWANAEGMAGMDFQEAVKRSIPEGWISLPVYHAKPS